MDYTINGLGAAWLTCVIAVALAFAFGGGVVNLHPRHIGRARFCGQLVAIIACGYPVLWARGAHYAPWVIVVCLVIFGMTMGAIHYAIGLWYRSEVARPNDESGNTEDPE